MKKENSVILRDSIALCSPNKVITTLDVLNSLFVFCFRDDYNIDDLTFKDLYDCVFDEVMRGMEIWK